MPKPPHSIDRALGWQVCRQRRRVGLSQSQLGQMVGLTYQQIQKYENGANRISASKLFEISKALSVSVQSFFVELFEDPSMMWPPSSDAEIDRLAKAFLKIEDQEIRKKIFNLVQAIAASDVRDRADVSLSFGGTSQGDGAPSGDAGGRRRSDERIPGE